MLKRTIRNLDLKYLILWFLSLMIVVFYMSNPSDLECDTTVNNQNQRAQQDTEKNAQHVQYLRLKDDNSVNLFGEYNKNEKLAGEAQDQVLSYNRHMPIMFVGGVPRSGTTLMRAMLDAHPAIRCGEETRIVPRIITMRQQWKMSKKENERLKNAGITDEIIDAAIGSFILEVIVRHGKPAAHLCNKDPLVLRHASYMKDVFPNGKFILMIRDGRATVHSIISRKVTITGFNLDSYEDCLIRWNSLIEHMYAQCIELGEDSCMPVHYEQLVLHPETQMRAILKFLNIPWDKSVLEHEKHIGDEVSLSKVERSSDQVVKPVNLDALSSWVGKMPADVVAQMDTIAPMLKRLGYDPMANPPNYGQADAKIKENTLNIKTNKDYWKKIAEEHSIHAKDKFVP